MKLIKKFVIITIIAASAVILSGVRDTCNSGIYSFPFSFISRLINNNSDIERGIDSSIFSATACAGELKTNFKVTFIELGSVNCIPCKMMQPVMKQVEQKYGSQVKVVFHDVWTEKGQPYGQQYRIRVIPTQIFLDSSGKEYSRHEGYFSFEELEKVLKKGGVR